MGIILVWTSKGSSKMTSSCSKVLHATHLKLVPATALSCETAPCNNWSQEAKEPGESWDAKLGGGRLIWEKDAPTVGHLMMIHSRSAMFSFQDWWPEEPAPEPDYVGNECLDIEDLNIMVWDSKPPWFRHLFGSSQKVGSWDLSHLTLLRSDPELNFVIKGPFPKAAGQGVHTCAVERMKAAELEQTLSSLRLLLAIVRYP